MPIHEFFELDHRSVGAQFLQARLGDVEPLLFYLGSPAGTAAPDADDQLPVRGGVSVLFPQFAQLGRLPEHGLVRDVPWKLMRDESLASTRVVTYALNMAKTPAWPHLARLVVEAEISDGSLEMRMQVTNRDKSRFKWTGGLHPYFLVEHVCACPLGGLVGLPVRDRHDPTVRLQSSEWAMSDTGPTERLYDGCPPLTLSAGTQRLTLEATGFDQWMVWNPGEQGVRTLAGLPAADWSRFLCVMPVCATRPVMMKPGEIFVGTLSVRKVPVLADVKNRPVRK